MYGYYVLLALLSSTTLAYSQRCVDGKTNVISIEDIGKDSSVRFHNVKLLTYDARRKPFCRSGKASLHFPGFIRFVSGEVEVVRPVAQGPNDVKLAFTAEHNSYWIGRVCEAGTSQNSFVGDEVCGHFLCQLIGADACRLFAQPQRVPISAIYNGFIPLGPSEMSLVEGEWKAGASLIEHGKQVAAVWVGDQESWVPVQVGDATDEQHFEKEKEKVLKRQEL